eukprot:12089994-Prorocentrum_lima.AAC.1
MSCAAVTSLLAASTVVPCVVRRVCKTRSSCTSSPGHAEAPVRSMQKSRITCGVAAPSPRAELL